MIPIFAERREYFQKLFECCSLTPNGVGLAHSSGIQRLETGRTGLGTLVLSIREQATNGLTGAAACTEQ
ncbi:MAG: hypothetical protein JO275_07130 [Verrucomicrobia bacterium]|nr:hypothetical protein [Verrucomicrobiota bacterium]